MEEHVIQFNYVAVTRVFNRFWTELYGPKE